MYATPFAKVSNIPFSKDFQYTLSAIRLENCYRMTTIRSEETSHVETLCRGEILTRSNIRPEDRDKSRQSSKPTTSKFQVTSVEEDER